MTNNSKDVVIGSRVVINNSSFKNFTIGKVYEVVEVGLGWVGLLNDLGKGDCGDDLTVGWCFYHNEFDVV